MREVSTALGGEKKNKEMRSLNVIFSVVISLFYLQVEDVADLEWDLWMLK